MAVVGIDLGTTYSIIATPQKFAGDAFSPLRGVNVILDPYKNSLVASVVTADPRGNILVGRRAKVRAGHTPAPIMFVKRLMGEETWLDLTPERRMLPEEISAEILRFLKEMAVEAMGEPIDEAVITVPAYFDGVQCRKTEEAAQIAGLRVGALLQEPVAAAMVYSLDDNRDPLTIMTYDLGGGTFDIAILRKENKVFQVKAYDGDQYLGGYDFDKKLAYWMIEYLNDVQGYDLVVDVETDEGRSTMSKLLVEAEKIKKALSDQTSYACYVQTDILDQNGEPVSIDLEISREMFEDLIFDNISDTIDLCRRAMGKTDPPISPEMIDEIILVGGSSRIPLVSRMLEDAFGIIPQLFEPDLCVAIGAALQARQLGCRVDMLKLGHIPEVTHRAAIQITGTLEPTESLRRVQGCTVTLTPADGSLPQLRQTNANGGFIFQKVPLVLNVDNGFTLSVTDPNGNPVVSHQLKIRREPESSGGGITTGSTTINVLAKPILIKTVTGLEVIAKEGSQLPHKCSALAQTVDQSGRVYVPIYEGSSHIGEVIVDVPNDLPIGSDVEVNLHLRNDFYIDAQAYVPSIDRSGQATIELPPKLVRNIEQLRNDLHELEQVALNALENAEIGRAATISPRLRKNLETCRRLLYEDPDPTLAKVQVLLDEVDAMIDQLTTWRPEPPAEEFDQLATQVSGRLRDLSASAPDAPIDDYEAQLDAIRMLAGRALDNEDTNGWIDAYNKLERLRDRVRAEIESTRKASAQRPDGVPSDPNQPPSPVALKNDLILAMMNLKNMAREQGRHEELIEQFATCDRELAAVTPQGDDDTESLIQLVGIIENHVRPLEALLFGSTTREARAESHDTQTGLLKTREVRAERHDTQTGPPKKPKEKRG